MPPYTLNPWSGQAEGVIDARPQRGGGGRAFQPPAPHRRAMQADRLARVLESMQMQSAVGEGRAATPPAGGSRIEDRLVEMLAGQAMSQQSAVAAHTRSLESLNVGAGNDSKFAEHIARVNAELEETAKGQAFTRSENAATNTHNKTLGLEAQRHGLDADEREARIGLQNAEAAGIPTAKQSALDRLVELKATQTGVFPGDEASGGGLPPDIERRVMLEDLEAARELGVRTDVLAKIHSGEMSLQDTVEYRASKQTEREALIKEMVGKLDSSSWWGDPVWEEPSIIDAINPSGKPGYWSMDEGTGPGTVDNALERVRALQASDPRYQQFGIRPDEIAKRYRLKE